VKVNLETEVVELKGEIKSKDEELGKLKNEMMFYKTEYQMMQSNRVIAETQTDSLSND
jgi:hypothetical protein